MLFIKNSIVLEIINKCVGS